MSIIGSFCIFSSNLTGVLKSYFRPGGVLTKSLTLSLIKSKFYNSFLSIIKIFFMTLPKSKIYITSFINKINTLNLIIIAQNNYIFNSYTFLFIKNIIISTNININTILNINIKIISCIITYYFISLNINK